MICRRSLYSHPRASGILSTFRARVAVRFNTFRSREWNSALSSAHRSFGASPSRVRPVETPREHAWRQSEREVSAALLIAFMFIVPLWMVVLSNREKREMQEELLRHATSKNEEKETSPSKWS